MQGAPFGSALMDFQIVHDERIGERAFLHDALPGQPSAWFASRSFRLANLA